MLLDASATNDQACDRCVQWRDDPRDSGRARHARDQEQAESKNPPPAPTFQEAMPAELKLEIVRHRPTGLVVVTPLHTTIAGLIARR